MKKYFSHVLTLLSVIVLIFSFIIPTASAQIYNIQTKTSSDSSQQTVFTGAGTNTTINTAADGKTKITDSAGKTTADYQAAPLVTVPTNSKDTPNTGLTLTPGAGGTYTLLAPIETFFPGGTVDVKGAGLGGYLNGLYRAGIAIAT
ncbi:MAG: hypothetical protein K9M11_03710, partial [Candidatus Pacebacteria bacterium]|nr:hypothetical protein [Candidatus Paceibacterota bacterium]